VAYRSHQLRIAALAAVAFAASSPGQSFLISVFVDDMLAGTGLGRTTFSALYAAGTIVSAICMLLLGRVVDRRGVRVAWAAVTSGLAVACGLASVAAGAVVVFFALALLRTSGQGSFPLLGTILVARSFERRRGQAMAAANLGLTAASIVLPPAVAALIVAVGWRHAYQTLGVALLLLVLPLALLITDGPRRADDGAASGAEEVVYPPATRAAMGGRLAVPTLPAALMLLVITAPPLVATALTFHAVSILAERGLSLVQSGFALSTLGVAAAVGTVVAGAITDRLDNRVLLTLVSVITLAAPLVLLVAAPLAAYAAFGTLGLAMGGVGVVNGTVWSRTYGTRQLGRIQGTAQSSMITAAALAPLVPAVSHAATGGYDAAIVALAGFTALTTVVAVRWRPARRDDV
jgi:MFS family permease